MKALSIRQPWAWLIINGHKRIENREWYASYRGPLLIHASKTFDDDWAFWFIESRFPQIVLPQRHEYPLGAIVGEVNLVKCVSDWDSRWFVGPYGFVLEDPVAYPKPIPYRGSLGLFDVPDEILKVAWRQKS